MTATMASASCLQPCSLTLISLKPSPVERTRRRTSRDLDWQTSLRETSFCPTDRPLWKEAFFVNKDVETVNMQEDTMVAHRLVCDFVSQYGGVTKVPLIKELLTSAASARSRYRIHLDQERRKQESDAKAQKRKAAEDYLQELKKKRKTLQEVSESLARDADMFAEQAEGKTGSQMAQLIIKSNALGRGCKEKLAELKNIVEEIEVKREKLRST